MLCKGRPVLVFGMHMFSGFGKEVGPDRRFPQQLCVTINIIVIIYYIISMIISIIYRNNFYI